MVELCGQFLLTQGPLAGKRFKEAMLPWQRKLIKKAWGDGCTTIGLKIGKGSGKTTLASAIALASVIDWSTRGVNTRNAVIIVSATVEAARIAFEHIVEGVRADPYLAAKFKSNISRKEITHISSGITIRVISPQLESAVGLRPGLLLADEIHQAAIASREFGKVVDQLRRGGGNAEEFRFISLTTAASSRPEGYFRDWLAKMRAIRDGELTDPTVLPILFEFPPTELRPDLDVTNPDEWWRGMPSLRTKDNPLGTMDAKELEAELREAADSADINGPGEMESLLSQRLGLESIDRGGGTGSTAVARNWAHCYDADMLVRTDTALIVGMDPSAGLDDPFALAVVMREGDEYFVWSRQYLVQDTYERAPRNLKVVYDKALDAGELFLADSTALMEREVFNYCRSMKGTIQFGGDARGLAGFSRRFQERIAQYIPVAQNWELRAAVEFAGALAFDRRLHHNNQPLLSANIANVKMENGRLVKYDGTSSGVGSAKIDGAMAMFSAIQIAESQPMFDPAALIG
jgi:phage terminase large subunit-like protein